MLNNKVLIMGTAILLLAVGLSGCTSSLPQVKITSVDISENHPNYSFSITLKNIGDEGCEGAEVDVKLYVWMDTNYWYLDDVEWRQVGYIDSSDSYTTTISCLQRMIPEGINKLKVEVTVLTENGGGDTYTEEFYGKPS